MDFVNRGTLLSSRIQREGESLRRALAVAVGEGPRVKCGLREGPRVEWTRRGI